MSSLPTVLHRHHSALTKTTSYYALHVAVAACVAYAVTGSWAIAMGMSLLEPSVQAVAYFVHDKCWDRVAVRRWRNLCKSLSYYAVHLAVATAVGYAVTGSWRAALALSLLEPTVQMFFFYVHEKFWDAKQQRSSRQCPHGVAMHTA